MIEQEKEFLKREKEQKKAALEKVKIDRNQTESLFEKSYGFVFKVGILTQPINSDTSMIVFLLLQTCRLFPSDSSTRYIRF